MSRCQYSEFMKGPFEITVDLTENALRALLTYIYYDEEIRVFVDLELASQLLRYSTSVGMDDLAGRSVEVIAAYVQKGGQVPSIPPKCEISPQDEWSNMEALELNRLLRKPTGKVEQTVTVVVPMCKDNGDETEESVGTDSLKEVVHHFTSNFKVSGNSFLLALTIPSIKMCTHIVNPIYCSVFIQS
jgi:hypothetical protein